MKTIIDLFTGSSKSLYIALIILGLGFVGISSLSLSLYGDKAALQTTIIDNNATIEKQNKLIDAQAKEVKRLDKDLAQTKADLQMQNAINAQYAIDIARKEKEYQEALAKKPLFRTQYVTVERTDNEAKDLQNFVIKWRDKK